MISKKKLKLNFCDDPNVVDSLRSLLLSLEIFSDRISVVLVYDLFLRLKL